MPVPPAAVLTADIRVGAAQHSGALTVFPLFRRDAHAEQLEYRSFAQAVAEGFLVRELPDRASVNDLSVLNPLDVPVLLYDGEQVSGAQQDRTLDRSVLVPAGVQLTVPVSCVEAGRWDGSRRDEAFAPAPQTAYPTLRAMKHRQSTGAAAAGGEARADQGAVWDEVAAMASRRGAQSPTGAMDDVFAQDEEGLTEVVSTIDRHPAQVGAVAVIHGAIAVLDYVSRADVWAALHRPLVRGYALDALDADAPGAPRGSAPLDEEAVQAWTAGLLSATTVSRRAVGLGEDLALTRPDGATGAALRVDGELIQLSAFPGPPPERARGARVQRPSRRR